MGHVYHALVWRATAHARCYPARRRRAAPRAGLRAPRPREVVMPIRRWNSALILSVLLAVPAAAATRPWTMDDILALRTVTDPQVSPDGRSVVYVISELNMDGSDYNTDL